LIILCVSLAACTGEEAVTEGCIDSDSGIFMLYPYDDAQDHGDSSIKMARQSVRNENGTDETVWALSGRVTAKYQYGYAGLSIIPDDKALARLRNGAKEIRLWINGDGKRYRFSVEMEDAVGDNTFGKSLVFPRRMEEAVIHISSDDLKQNPGWGIKTAFNPSLITTLKIQTIGQPVSSFKFRVHRIEIR
jgi:hypothetical protein